MPKDDTNNQKEVSLALNAAVAISLRPARLGPIPEGRLRKLHEIAKALVAPAQELLIPDEHGVSALEPEELTAILAVAALYVQLHDVMKTTKHIPFGGLSREVFASEG